MDERQNIQTEDMKEVKSEPVRRFGRGIYDSKDVPIRLLDGFIAGVIAVIVIMIIIFALNGGYVVSFDSRGGTEVATQKLRYGKLIEEPEAPTRQGYEFTGWYCEGEPEKNWDFAVDKVGGDMTLTAGWKQEQITAE